MYFRNEESAYEALVDHRSEIILYSIDIAETFNSFDQEWKTQPDLYIGNNKHRSWGKYTRVGARLKKEAAT